MSYTTVAKVRQVSGFVGNSAVSDAFISSQITRAEGLINSLISSAYALPLPKFHLNTIVFSGTGSGSGTMTLTVGGSSFEVAVIAGLTASQAADLFRTAALDNDAFVADGLGGGSTVTFHTVDGDDPAQVTVTSSDPQTVAGVTATGGTVTEAAAPMVEYLATEIAAAMLLITEYGPESQDTDKDGFKRMAELKKVLKAVAAKSEKLYGFAGVELPTASTKRIAYYPHATSEEDPDNPTHSRVRMAQKF